MSNDDNENNFLAVARLFPSLFKDDIRSYTPPFSSDPPTTDDLQEALRRTYVAPLQPDHRSAIIQMLQETYDDQKADNDAFPQSVGTQIFPSNATPPPQSNSSLTRSSPPTLASAINLPDEEPRDDIGTAAFEAGKQQYALQLREGRAYLARMRAYHPGTPQYNDAQIARIGEKQLQLEDDKAKYPEIWGAPFTSQVMKKVEAFGPIVKKPEYDLDRIGQAAVLKLIGEEYATSTGSKKNIDMLQDANAATGNGDTNLQIGKLFLLKSAFPIVERIPASVRTGTEYLRPLAQLDFLNHDVGPANINIRSAMELNGDFSKQDPNRIGKDLTNSNGIVDYSSRFVKQAQKDIAPLLKGLDERTQIQLVTDYVRKGTKKFWDDVMKNRKLTESQIEAWKQSPDTYIGPNGKTPVKLWPSRWVSAQFRQIEDTLTKNYPPKS